MSRRCSDNHVKFKPGYPCRTLYLWDIACIIHTEYELEQIIQRQPGQIKLNIHNTESDIYK